MVLQTNTLAEGAIMSLINHYKLTEAEDVS